MNCVSRPGEDAYRTRCGMKSDAIIQSLSEIVLHEAAKSNFGCADVIVQTLDRAVATIRQQLRIA